MAAEQNIDAERAAFEVFWHNRIPAEQRDSLHADTLAFEIWLAARRSATIGEGGLPAQGVSVASMLELIEQAKKLPKMSSIEPVPLTPIQIAFVAGKMADLRAQIVRQSQGKPDAYLIRDNIGNHGWSKWSPCSVEEYELRKPHTDVFQFRALYAAPPLSSEQQATPETAGQAQNCRSTEKVQVMQPGEQKADATPAGQAEVFRVHVGMIATDDDAGPYLKIRFRTMPEADAAFDWIFAVLSNTAPAQQAEKGGIK